ncbi:hypothetical protein JAAARDRAFT_201070 [Jaapia argillacea MUCL 33604]|uniref:C2H2-type domain-containing protein n=1 Tax=Jaapia argillacea MUCL 33604 TaxID=933084 RepID=A0A067P355_9AGAM|nr:hypothetical protein JAAARDRAFT_201070 [Jaapia argillacea MUCL 33604]
MPESFDMSKHLNATRREDSLVMPSASYYGSSLLFNHAAPYPATSLSNNQNDQTSPTSGRNDTLSPSSDDCLLFDMYINFDDDPTTSDESPVEDIEGNEIVCGGSPSGSATGSGDYPVESLGFGHYEHSVINPSLIQGAPQAHLVDGYSPYSPSSTQGTSPPLFLTDQTQAPSPPSTASTPSSTNTSSTPPTSSYSSYANTPNLKGDILPHPYYAPQFSFPSNFANPTSSINSQNTTSGHQVDTLPVLYRQQISGAYGYQVGSMHPPSVLPVNTYHRANHSAEASGSVTDYPRMLPTSIIAPNSYLGANRLAEASGGVNEYPRMLPTSGIAPNTHFGGNRLAEVSGGVTGYPGSEYLFPPPGSLPSFEPCPRHPAASVSTSNTGFTLAVAGPSTAMVLPSAQIDTPQQPVAGPSRHSQEVRADRQSRQTPYSRPAVIAESLICRWAGCGQSIPETRWALNQHLSGVHHIRQGDDGTVTLCRWEGCTLDLKSAMRRHVAGVHCGLLKTECHLGCGKKFSRSDAMRRHLKTCQGS